MSLLWLPLVLRVAVRAVAAARAQQARGAGALGAPCTQRAAQ
jgi:hypothetical protein